MLVQHILQLPLGIAFKSHELEPEPVPLLPAHHSEGNDDRRPGAGRFHFETKMRADGKVDVALNFTAGDGEIFQHPVSGPLVSGKQNRIVDLDSRSGPRLHTSRLFSLYRKRCTRRSSTISAPIQTAPIEVLPRG